MTDLVRIDEYAYEVGSDAARVARKRDAERRSQELSRLGFANRLDAAGVAFIGEQLSYLSSVTQETLYAALRAAEFVPITSEVPAGADTWRYRQNDGRGIASSGPLSGNDFPLADVSTEEFSYPVVNALAGYEITEGEMLRSAETGEPLPQRKARQCADMIARKLDEYIRIGDPAQGFTGLFNNPNVPVVTLTNGSWSTATASQILADVRQAEQAIIANTKDRHAASHLVLPTAYDGYIRKERTNSDVNVATWFVSGNSRMINTISRWDALDDATGTDVTVTDPPLGILFPPDPDVLSAEIPVPYREAPPERRGLSMVTPAYARFAGLTIKRPLAMAYLENLD